jgi:hypothetical protein
MAFPSVRVVGIVGLITLSMVAATTTAATDPPELNDKQFHEKLLTIARIYTTYGRVDDEARWAPLFCRMPNPAQAHASRSNDEATHGQKLYSLFARDRGAYTAAPDKANPVGQVIIKESWLPEEVKREPAKQRRAAPAERPVPKIDVPADLASKEPLAGLLANDSFHPYAQKNGKVYKAAKKGDLFIMFKVDPKTAGTDEGWVYGTVTADGKQVTSAGRVASCMKCHETRKDRLFGSEASPVLKHSIEQKKGK